MYELDQKKAETTIVPSVQMREPAYAELTRWQLSAEDILLELEHDLRGEVWDEKAQKYVGKGIAFLNEEGIRAVISILRGKINKNMYLTNLTTDDVYAMTYDLALDVIDVIFLKYKTYDIDKANLSLVANQIIHFVYAAFKRALEEGERHFIQSMHKVTEKTVITPPETEKKGLFGLFSRK